MQLTLIEWQHFFQRKPISLDQLPSDVRDEFTYGKRIPLFHLFIDGSKDMFVTDQVWDEDYIGDLRRQFRNGKLSGAYGYHEVKAISRHIDEKVSNNVSVKRMF